VITSFTSRMRHAFCAKIFAMRKKVPPAFSPAGAGNAATTERAGSFLGLVPFAAISFLVGALVSRFGWIAVGKVSGSDPESVFAAERY
jgi:hypothetical protein